MSYWGWGASVVLFAGLWFVGNRAWWAFLLTIVGESVWTVIAVNRRQYDLAAICVVFTLVALRNLVVWRRQPTCGEIALRLARHMHCGPRDPAVLNWLSCPGVVAKKPDCPLDLIAQGRGDLVIAWLDANWGPAPPEPHEEAVYRTNLNSRRVAAQKKLSERPE